MYIGAWEVVWAYRVDQDPMILNPTGYMLTSSGFASFI